MPITLSFRFWLFITGYLLVVPVAFLDQSLAEENTSPVCHQILTDQEIIQRWSELKPYSYQAGLPREQTFIVDGGPPTLSGHLHLGHVLSYVPVDILTRFQRMRGHTVFYPMGLDTNGLPTMKILENTYNVSVRTHAEQPGPIDWADREGQPHNSPPLRISREQAREACDQLVCKWGDEYWKVWDRLGLGLDRSLSYHTFDDNHMRFSQEAFLELIQKGHVAHQPPVENYPPNLIPSKEENDGAILKFTDASGRPAPLWFMRMLDLKQDLLNFTNTIDIAGAASRSALKAKLREIDRDWVLSRSRHFGIPIPVWYPISKEGVPQFDQPIFPTREQLPVDPTRDTPPGYDPSQRDQRGGFVADKNVLDTWFTSTMTYWIQAMVHGDAGLTKLYPADLRTHGIDVLVAWTGRGLFRSMLIDSNAPGFDSVIVHGNVLGPDGHKMSKSLGNVIDPIEILNNHGGDPVRFWTAIANQSHAKFSPESIVEAENFLKVFEERADHLRWIIDNDPGLKDLSIADIKMPFDLIYLSHLNTTLHSVTNLLEANSYDYKGAVQKAMNGFRYLNGFYIYQTERRSHFVKNSDRESLRSCLATMQLALQTYTKMLAPFFPFSAERVWQKLGTAGKSSSVHMEPWPVEFSGAQNINFETKQAYALLEEFFKKVEAQRRKSQTALRMIVYGFPEDVHLMKNQFENLGIKELLNISGPVEYIANPSVIPLGQRFKINLEY